MSRERATQTLTAGAVVLVGLAAAQPLLAGRLPWAADTLIHLYRLVELDHLLRHGYLFSRWAPDLAYGYGFPLFNFYAPLSYYIAEILRLVGMDFAPAMLATFAALVVAAGLGMYAWAAGAFGRRAGLVAASAYVTAPYMLYNAYHRSALAEVLAMALMPVILWAMTRLARSGARRFFVLTALLCAALFLGHNVTTILFAPVMLIYAGILVAGYGACDRRRIFYLPRSIVRVALALALGLGLAAFFWVPMFAERGTVQIFQLFLPEAFDYHFHFVAWRELFSPPVAFDPNLVLPPIPRSVGLIPLILAIVALALRWRRWTGQQQITASFAALVVVVSLSLTLPQSGAIWDALPLLRFVQFPWRFLGMASLGLAFLAGGAFVEHGNGEQPAKDENAPHAVVRRPSFVIRHGSFVVIILAGLIVYGFTWQYVSYLAPIVRPTVADIARYERESGALGTTSAGDYLPGTVIKLPDADTLAGRYLPSGAIERLDPASLPPDAQVLQADYGLLSSDVTVASPSPFVATFDVFYFAGWQARVDDRPAAITPTDPHGLISFPVPAGQHRLQVFFGSTPLRTGASVVSLLSLLALAVASVLLFDRRQWTADRSLRPAPGELRLATCICIVAVGLIALKSLYLDAHETILRRTRFDGAHVADVERPLEVNFDNQMALMGVEPASPVVEMGASVRVALYWRAFGNLDADYSISAQFVDERGFVYGQRDSQHPGGYPTSRWTPGDYARDVHDIALAPGTPPGEYRLQVGVYRVGVPGGLDVLDANHAPAGKTVDVATVLVKRHDGIIPSRPALPQPDHPSGATLAPGLALFGYDLPQAEVNAGATMPFTLYWQATAAQTHDLKARLQLADANGAVVFTADVAPISPQFPTSRLLRGDVMRGANAVRIPALTPGGILALRLTLMDDSGALQGDAADLGRVTVRVPQRTMTAPRAQYPMQVNLGYEITLAGYDIRSLTANLSSPIEIVLYWQALREMTSDYKSFVHLLDASGRFIVGSDAIPANWTRPTTGWVAGEYVSDSHTLALPANLPPGHYGIEVGMYDAATGARLGERVLLNQPIVVGP